MFYLCTDYVFLSGFYPMLGQPEKCDVISLSSSTGENNLFGPSIHYRSNLLSRFFDSFGRFLAVNVGPTAGIAELHVHVVQHHVSHPGINWRGGGAVEVNWAVGLVHSLFQNVW